MINISIIIPTYKRPSVMARCLKLLSQSQYLNEQFKAEVVIVDTSPDQSTWEQIKSYQKYFELNYLHLKNQALPAPARNLAVSRAKNELIVSIDSDIEVKKETVWQMIQYLKNHPTVARMTGKSIFSSGSKKGQIDRPTKWDRIFQQNNTTYIEGIYGRYEAFYKSAFEEVGGYDEIFEFCGEGTDLSVRFWRAGFPLAIDPNVVAYHNSEAPESLRRIIPDRMTQMYRSLFLVAYKYDVGDPNLSPHFIESHQERQTAYGNTTEFHAIAAAAKSIDWFKDNYRGILESKKKVPREFDFKPFDIFTIQEQELLKKCLDKTKDRIAPYYQKVF